MTLLLEFMPALLLTFARITAMITAMMFLGTTGDSRWPRLLLAITLSLLIFMRSPEVIAVDGGLPALALLTAREVVLGLMFGFTIQLIFVSLRMTGSVLGHEMGFTMAQVVDPTTGVSSPVVGRFFETLSFLFMLSIDAHHEVFRILSSLFERVPVGRSWNLSAIVESMWKLAGEGIQLSVAIATPVYACLILLTVVLVVLSRAVPQIHLMEFGYALRILIALGATWLFFGIIAPFLYRLFDTMLSGARNMVELAAS